MPSGSSAKNSAKSRNGVSPVFIAIGIVIILVAVGYFLFSSGIKVPTGRGFEVDIDTGADQVAKAAEAATNVPDTNAFDEINPYGYKNPFR